jgi:hypothetical protein
MSSKILDVSATLSVDIPHFKLFFLGALSREVRRAQTSSADCMAFFALCSLKSVAG